MGQKVAHGSSRCPQWPMSCLATNGPASPSALQAPSGLGPPAPPGTREAPRLHGPGHVRGRGLQSRLTCPLSSRWAEPRRRRATGLDGACSLRPGEARAGELLSPGRRSAPCLFTVGGPSCELGGVRVPNTRAVHPAASSLKTRSCLTWNWVNSCALFEGEPDEIEPSLGWGWGPDERSPGAQEMNPAWLRHLPEGRVHRAQSRGARGSRSPADLETERIYSFSLGICLCWKP